MWSRNRSYMGPPGVPESSFRCVSATTHSGRAAPAPKFSQGSDGPGKRSMNQSAYLYPLEILTRPDGRNQARHLGCAVASRNRLGMSSSLLAEIPNEYR